MTVVVDEKGAGCVISLHVRDLPLTTTAKRCARRRASSRSKKKSTRKKASRASRRVSALRRFELHLQLGHERQVVRRHQRQPRPRQLQLHHLDLPLVVDVIEVQHREHAGIRAPPPQVRPQVDALQPLAEHLRRQPPHPLVEVAEHDLRLADAAVVDDGAQPPRLVAPLEERRAEVDVVQVQRVVVDRRCRRAGSSAARTSSTTGRTALWWRIGKPAEDDVAEQAAAQMPDAAPSPSPCRAAPRAPRRVPRTSGRRRSLPAARRRPASIARMTSAIRAGLVRPSRPRQRWML